MYYQVEFYRSGQLNECIPTISRPPSSKKKLSSEVGDRFLNGQFVFLHASSRSSCAIQVKKFSLQDFGTWRFWAKISETVTGEFKSTISEIDVPCYMLGKISSSSSCWTPPPYPPIHSSSSCWTPPPFPSWPQPSPSPPPPYGPIYPTPPPPTSMCWRPFLLPGSGDQDCDRNGYWHSFVKATSTVYDNTVYCYRWIAEPKSWEAAFFSCLSMDVRNYLLFIVQTHKNPLTSLSKSYSSDVILRPILHQ